jgi:outer membrane protein
MKKILMICMFGLLIFGSNVAFAALKIGIVNMQQLINQDPMVQVLRGKITNEFKPQNKKMVALRKLLLKNIDKLKKQPSANVTTRKKLRTRIAAQAKQLRALQVTLRDNVLNEQRKAIAAITQQIQVAIGEVASREGIDLVLRRSSILFYGKILRGSDITPAVNKILHGR